MQAPSRRRPFSIIVNKPRVISAFTGGIIPSWLLGTGVRRPSTAAADNYSFSCSCCERYRWKYLIAKTGKCKRLVRTCLGDGLVKYSPLHSAGLPFDKALLSTKQNPIIHPFRISDSHWLISFSPVVTQKGSLPLPSLLPVKGTKGVEKILGELLQWLFWEESARNCSATIKKPKSWARLTSSC